MNSQQEHLHWNNLDGIATEQERLEWQIQFNKDEGFKAQFKSRQLLHECLRKMETEQPSIRFVKNVMDQLPPLYKKTIEPLIKPQFIKIFFVGLGMTISSIFFFAVLMDRTEYPMSFPGDKLLQQFNTLPVSVFSTLALISVSGLCLVLLDWRLKKRFVK